MEVKVSDTNTPIWFTHGDSHEIVTFNYTYDGDGNILAQEFDHVTPGTAGGPDNDYAYDTLDRLTRTDYLDTNENEQFTYDTLGNRLTLNDRDGTTHVYLANEVNEYTKITIGGNDCLPVHDNAGNMTEDAEGYEYDYDYENRLTAVRDDVDNAVAAYTYDALGRRIEKIQYETAGNLTTRYYYDGWRVFTETDADDTTEREFAYGNYLDEVLFMRDVANTDDYIFCHDHLYSPVALVDDTGVIVERTRYDAYGKAKVWHIADVNDDGTVNSTDKTAVEYSRDNTYTWRCDLDNDGDVDNTDVSLCDGYITTTRPTGYRSYFKNPVAFTGQRLDTLDNLTLDLMYYKNRHYWPELGRFGQRDPLGKQTRPGLTGYPGFAAAQGLAAKASWASYSDSTNNPIALEPTSPDGVEGDLSSIFQVFQYRDGASLYQYCVSHPTSSIDSYGLACSMTTLDPVVMAAKGWTAEEIIWVLGASAFPTAEAVRMCCAPTYREDTGDCTEGEHAVLQAAVNVACKGTDKRSCKDKSLNIDEIKKRMNRNTRCARARRKINDKCFRGGDYGKDKKPHVDEMNKAWKAARDCAERYIELRNREGWDNYRP